MATGVGWQLNQCISSPAAPPEQLQATSVTPPYSVSVNVDEVFDRETLAADMDRDIFFVGPDENFYISLPEAQKRELRVYDGERFFAGISVYTIPFFGMTLESLAHLASTEEVLTGDIVTAEVRVGEPVLVTFLNSSRIGGVRFMFNPITNRHLSDEVLSMWIRLVDAAGGLESRLRVVQEIDRALPGDRLLEQRVSEELTKRLPDRISVQSGITIASFRKRYLHTVPLASPADPSLDQGAFWYLFVLQLMNPEMSLINVSHFEISKSNDVILIDSSFSLRDIEMNGRIDPSAQLVKLFLLVNDRAWVHVVRLQYLNGFLSRRSELELERSFASFRVFVN